MHSIVNRYGTVGLDRVDITDQECTSFDLREMTGGPTGPNETQEIQPGVFRLSVFKPKSGELPVGEIRVWHDGREISIVGHLTGRPGVVEVTPDHFMAAENDPEYANQLREWIKTL